MLIYFDLAQRKQLAMLDLLIAAYREGVMTDLEIRQEVDTVMTAVYICNISWYF